MRNHFSLFAFLGMAAVALGSNLRGLKVDTSIPEISDGTGPECLESLSNGDVSLSVELNGESAWVTSECCAGYAIVCCPSFALHQTLWCGCDLMLRCGAAPAPGS